MLVELKAQIGFFKEKSVHTIYFGGGTPSTLNIKYLDMLLTEVFNGFNIDKNSEITIECNPDDINNNLLIALKKMGFNRLSIGVQTFDNTILKQLNRTHNSKQSIDAVTTAKNCGFDNISIDLIFGLPNNSIASWKKDLKIALKLGVPHISAYSLTIETKTVMGHLAKKGSLLLPTEESVVQQMEIAMDTLEQMGYEHYEISNYALPTYRSKHNSNYWNGTPYLGIGPSAHSYDGTFRYWNKASNAAYMKNIEHNKAEIINCERLSKIDVFNEYLLTGLRTIDGCDLEIIGNCMGEKYKRHVLKELIPFRKDGVINLNNNTLTLTRKGKFLADRIISDLFIIDESDK